MKRITSRDNTAYKSIRRLVRSARTRKQEQRIVLDGVHLVRAYLDRFGPTDVELIVRESTAQEPEIEALTQEASSAAMSDSLFHQIAPVKSPTGILALAPLPQAIARPSPNGFQVLLDGLRDPGNVGAILRSAAAAGATTIHLSPDCADPWSPKCLRGGMGAQFVLPVQEHENLNLEASSLGSRLIACTAAGSTSLFEADLTGRVAFVIGGEGAGISPNLLSQTDQQLRIPMRDGIESLNAAQAATVCFYEWLRRSGDAST